MYSHKTAILFTIIGQADNVRSLISGQRGTLSTGLSREKGGTVSLLTPPHRQGRTMDFGAVVFNGLLKETDCLILRWKMGG